MALGASHLMAGNYTPQFVCTSTPLGHIHCPDLSGVKFWASQSDKARSKR